MLVKRGERLIVCDVDTEFCNGLLQIVSSRKRLIRNEITSPDLEDGEISVTPSDCSTSSLSSTQDEESHNLGEADDGGGKEYVDLRWDQFPNLVEYTFKVILCGDASVGKTSFLNQLCLKEFRESTIATIGNQFYKWHPNVSSS